MATDKQIAANKENAQKSTGPKTPRGKFSSSRNAIKHGFLAQSILLPGESQERFLHLKNTYLHQFQPQTQAEWDLIDTLLVNRWRLLRCWTYESTSLTHEQHEQAELNEHEDPPTQAMLARRVLDNPPKSQESLTRHEVRLDRQYYRALDRLREIKAEREKVDREKVEREKKEARKGTQFSEQNTRLSDSEIPNRTIEITQTNYPENPNYAH